MVGDEKGGLVVWDHTSNTSRISMPLSEAVTCFDSVPKSSMRIAVGYKTGLICIVLMSLTEQASITHKLRGHSLAIHCLAFSPYIADDGSCCLASGSRDRSIRVWNATDSEPMRTWHLPQQRAQKRSVNQSETGDNIWLTLCWTSPTEIISSSHGFV